MLDFLNPALLFGGLLFLVPLVIHLLNRQRFKRRPWAAMEFLLAAYKKQRRRLRRENLLLLLLRCLIPIVLAIAIARPLFRSDSLPSALGGSDSHHILVVDATGSMGMELVGATTPFERARAVASALLDRIRARESAPRVSLIVQGLRATQPIRDDLDLERCKARLAALPGPVDGGADLAEALRLAARIIDESTDSQIRVHLFTDLQSRAFGTKDVASTGRPEPKDPPADPGSEFLDNVADLLDLIRKRAEVTLFDMRGTDGGSESNVQITNLTLGTIHAIQKVPTPIVVSLRNRSDRSATAQVTIELDGGQPSRKSVNLEPGADGEAEFEITFQEAGAHRVRASIEGDALAMDDERALAVVVRDRIETLVVEGSNETDPALRTSTLLVEILDPTGGEGSADLTPFRPTIVEPVGLLTGRVRPADYDLVVLADVDRLNAQTGDVLSDAVRGGTGLLVMFGANTDPDSYVAHLRRGGLGPMPMTLGSPRGLPPGGDQWVRAAITARDHPILREFLDDAYLQLLELVPVWRYLGSELVPAMTGQAEPPQPDTPPDESATSPRGEVLVELRDAARSPWLVASQFGGGRALFLTSPIARIPERWNRFDSPVAGLPFLLLWPMAEWLTAPGSERRNVVVGESLSTTVSGVPRDLTIIVADRAGGAKQPLGEDARPLAGGRYALPAFGRTEHAGFYEFEMQLGDDGTSRHRELFAVGADVDEGQLDYLGHLRMRERFGFENVFTELPAMANAAVDSGVRELGSWFLWLTMSFLLGEAALARMITRRRT
ncbi:MAG: BatA domain-containing protein [Planctomycetota bacterium]